MAAKYSESFLSWFNQLCRDLDSPSMVPRKLMWPGCQLLPPAIQPTSLGHPIVIVIRPHPVVGWHRRGNLDGCGFHTLTLENVENLLLCHFCRHGADKQ